MSHHPLLSGKIVVITGGSSGIGAATARHFAAAGAHVALIARSPEKLQTTASALNARGYPCDITDETQVASAFAHIATDLGPVDILVNNAGLGFTTDLATVSLGDLRGIMDTNFTGTFLCARAVLPTMKARQSGHIINVSSIVGKVANPGAPLYCASKFALNGYTSGLQQQVAPDKIRVSLVSPASTDTAYWDGRQVDRAKFLAADEVAEAILFVATRPPGVLIKDMDLAALR